MIDSVWSSTAGDSAPVSARWCSVDVDIHTMLKEAPVTTTTIIQSGEPPF